MENTHTCDSCKQRFSGKKRNTCTACRSIISNHKHNVKKFRASLNILKQLPVEVKCIVFEAIDMYALQSNNPLLAEYKKQLKRDNRIRQENN
jgi:BioD-like phosphotransacetylase family protein